MRGRRIALAGVALLLLLGGVRIHAGQAQLRGDLDAVRGENRRLTVRQEILRGRIFELARRIEELESGTVAAAAPSGARSGLVAGPLRPSRSKGAGG